eukprot:scaffold2430_cov159-Amphora_coffeaeformis.AAC.6
MTSMRMIMSTSRRRAATATTTFFIQKTASSLILHRSYTTTRPTAMGIGAWTSSTCLPLLLRPAAIATSSSSSYWRDLWQTYVKQSVATWRWWWA